MIETWKLLIEVCEEKHIDPALITNPKAYTDHRQAAARAIVIRELNEQKVGFKNILALCPLTERGIRKILIKKQ